MGAANGGVLTKGGAEGVYVAALPHLGLGIAVKIDDGAKRAAETALAGLLIRFGNLGEQSLETVRSYVEAPIRNIAEARVGTLRLAAHWLT
jgi:L-asparaginase II